MSAGGAFWVVEWKHSSKLPAEYPPVAALLRYDLPVDRVAEIVQALHDARALDQRELLDRALANAKQPYTAEIHQGANNIGEIVLCGHNPYVEAARRRNVHWENDRIVYRES